MVLLTALGDEGQARSLARDLVTAGLAACVTLLPGAQSTYRWKEGITVDTEVILIMKTPRDRVQPLKERLAAQHPYEVPEILVFEAREGSPDYLAWLRAATRSPWEGE